LSYVGTPYLTYDTRTRLVFWHTDPLEGVLG